MVQSDFTGAHFQCLDLLDSGSRLSVNKNLLRVVHKNLVHVSLVYL